MNQMTAEIKAAQESGQAVLVVDLAGVFDRAAAHEAGVDVAALLKSTPDSPSQAVEVTENVIRSGAVGVVVFFGVLGVRPRARLHELAAMRCAVFHYVEAERVPVPPSPAEVEAALVAALRRADRAAAKMGLAAVARVSARAAVLAAHEGSKPAHYALAWALGTGRFSAEMERAILKLPPRAFAREALKIAGDLGGHAVREIYDAWRGVALRAALTSMS